VRALKKKRIIMSLTNFIIREDFLFSLFKNRFELIMRSNFPTSFSLTYF